MMGLAFGGAFLYYVILTVELRPGDDPFVDVELNCVGSSG
jgi:hypothetical protein